MEAGTDVLFSIDPTRPRRLVSLRTLPALLHASQGAVLATETRDASLAWDGRHKLSSTFAFALPGMPVSWCELLY